MSDKGENNSWLRECCLDCIIHSFGGMLCAIESSEDFRNYWYKLKEILLFDYESPGVNLMPADNYHPWFQDTEFGTDFMKSCFDKILNVLTVMVEQGLIKSDKDLEEFFKEIEIKFVELICDENVLFKTLNEIDERLEAIKRFFQD